MGLKQTIYGDNLVIIWGYSGIYGDILSTYYDSGLSKPGMYFIILVVRDSNDECCQCPIYWVVLRYNPVNHESTGFWAHSDLSQNRATLK